MRIESFALRKGELSQPRLDAAARVVLSREALGP